MKTNMTTRVVFIVLAVILAVYLLIPTIKISMMSDAEEAALKKDDPQALVNLKSKAISLGLDLQGGMHVLLEVDMKELLNKLARNKNKEFLDALKETSKIVSKSD